MEEGFSFTWMARILFCMCKCVRYIFIIYSSVNGLSVCFPGISIVNNTAMNNQYFFFSFPLDMHPEAGLLD